MTRRTPAPVAGSERVRRQWWPGAGGLLAGLAVVPLGFWLSWSALQAGPSGAPLAPGLAGAPIHGQVTDLATGLPLPGAIVVADTAATATDAEGRYRLTVPPGRHDVRVVADGYVGTTLVAVTAGPADQPANVALPPANPAEAAARAGANRLTAREASELAQAAAAAPVAMAAPITAVPAVIRVLMPDGTIVAMDTDDYLKGVVPAEMGFVFRRALEALKAQAIASRTYAATACLADSAGDPGRCEPGLDANVDTTTRTQVWRPVHYDVTDEAVQATHGQAARDGDALIRALFFARTSLRTLDSEDSPCCGNTVTRYLRSVSSPEAFGVRWGHGAGMSQEGAAVFGAWGATAAEIVEHYYSGVRVDPPGQPRLFDAGASPRSVGPGDVVTFTVGYADPDGDPPAVAHLLVDGQPRPMRALSAAGADFRLGVTYAVSATLPAGQHGLTFRFEDGLTGPVTLDGGAITVTAGAPDRAKGAPVPARPGVPAAAGTTLAGSVALPPTDLAPVAGALIARSDAAVAPAGAGAAVLESPPHAADFPFMAVAARWDGTEPAGAAVELAVRTSRDGVSWSAWTPLSEDDTDARSAAADGAHWTRLLVARGRYLRLRVVLSATDDAVPVLGGVTLHYLNSDAGPVAPPAAAQAAAPRVIARSGWGADESLRFKDGQEIWPVEYTQPRAQIVHHTVTTNDPADPAAVVRSIYYYHAVTRGWGDIGYNFLVDHRGNVYEGRYGGERNGQITQGGHALQFNANTIGVALLGTFTDVQPSTAARAALVDLLAAKGQQYGLDPYAGVTLAGSHFAYRVLGHRDVLPGHTSCPGDTFYPDMPAIRQSVAAAMAAATPTRPPPSATPTRRPASATPYRTPTAPVPTTPIPGECADGVANGGFEVEDNAWVRNRASYSGYDVYRGAKAMFVGLRNDEADTAQTYASVQQTVQLPPRIGSARLTFAAASNGDEADRRLVRLMDASGAVIALGNTTLPAKSGWTTYDLDVTAALAGRGGQAVRVYFAVINNGDGQRSYVRLDDVALVVCGPPGPTSATATPSPSPVQPPDTATPGPSPTPRPTATPAPPACANRLPAGDFEAPGLADWTTSGEHPAQRIAAPARSGAGALALGLVAPGTDGFGYAAVARDVTLPARMVSATLALADRPLSVGPGDAFVVELRHLADGSRHVLLGPEVADPLGVWTEHRFALDPAALGPSLQVYLAVLNRAQAGGPGAVTAVAVDDLRLDVCADARPSPAFLPALSRSP
jgi:hypothetical protein